MLITWLHGARYIFISLCAVYYGRPHISIFSNFPLLYFPFFLFFHSFFFWKHLSPFLSPRSSFPSLALPSQISFIFPPISSTKLPYNGLNNLFKLVATWKINLFWPRTAQPRVPLLYKAAAATYSWNFPFHRLPRARPRSGRANCSSVAPAAASNHPNRELTKTHIVFGHLCRNPRVPLENR